MECRYFNDTYFAHLQEAVEPKRSPQPSRKGNRSRSPSPSTLGALSCVVYIPSCMCAHRHNGFTSCVRAIRYCTIIVTDAVVQLECDYVSKIICGSPGQKTTMYCVKVLYH